MPETPDVRKNPDVRIGQVWADNDKRSTGRHLKVIAFTDFAAAAGGKPRSAVVVLCTPNGRTIYTNGKARRTRIKLARFRPTSTGYRLVHDVIGGAP